MFTPKVCTMVLGFALTSLPVFGASINGIIYKTGADLVPNASQPYATFTTADINYVSYSSAYTNAAFLNNPTFTSMKNGFDPNGTLANSFMEFTGQTFLKAGANAVELAHDDGAVLNFGVIGTVLSDLTGTSVSTTPFNVNAPTAGLYTFTLNYGENQVPPAVLIFKINGLPVGTPGDGSTTTPEPISMALTGSALVGLGILSRRRKNS